MMGYSWEGFVLEHISQLAPRGAEVMFYRTAAGAEMDVVVQHGSQTVCFEIKSSSAPNVTQGFYNAMQDLKPTATFIVAQVDKRYAFSEQVEVIGSADIAGALQSYARFSRDTVRVNIFATTRRRIQQIRLMCKDVGDQLGGRERLGLAQYLGYSGGLRDRDLEGHGFR